jgi:high-affinity iron transporter
MARVSVKVWLGALVSSLALSVNALAATPAEAGEIVRSSLTAAQIEMSFDAVAAQKLIEKARAAYDADLGTLGKADFDALETAIETGNEARFARDSARLWTNVLKASYDRLETAVKSDDFAAARGWLALREYRVATRFTTPDTDATLAVEALEAGKFSGTDALTAVRADLLDAYQSRLTDALAGLEAAAKEGFRVVASEQAALARGYFAILEPFFATAKLAEARLAFKNLETRPNLETLTAARGVLEGFRAAPLSPRERAKRAAQVFRFLGLVPVEYARGAKGGEGNVNIVKDLEITEATTFQRNAASSFADLEPLLVNLNRVGVKKAREEFATLEASLKAATLKQNPPTADTVQTQVSRLTRTLETLIPGDWRRADPAGDLEVIRQQLKAAEAAMTVGDFALAEQARIDAYSILESGPEARLKVFEPQLALDIESLFWFNPEPKGLAKLISERASAAQFKTSRLALEAKLKEASVIVGTDASPQVVFTNALIIVFREGLEAVLILAALLGSLKRKEVLHLRRPLWMGAAAAFVASLATFMVMRGIVNAFAVFGEKLEAVVSVVAIAVLLVIMNWFFHNVYWNDRLASFHKQKHGLIGAAGGQLLGLFVLGFTAMYREGFETALFLQSLILQSGIVTVSLGAIAALGLVALVGVAVFVMQTKLPHKKMLVATGVLICVVLGVMVGNTVHILQVVGWFPVHPLGIGFPQWAAQWLGTHPTWEGILTQVFAVSAVIGSYFLAEGLKHRELERRVQSASSAQATDRSHRSRSGQVSRP